MADEKRPAEPKNFIHALIDSDLAPGGQYEGMTVHTRFPPEPNVYLHIGHCKALCIDFGTAEKDVYKRPPGWCRRSPCTAGLRFPWPT